MVLGLWSLVFGLRFLIFDLVLGLCKYFVLALLDSDITVDLLLPTAPASAACSCSCRLLLLCVLLLTSRPASRLDRRLSSSAGFANGRIH